MVSSSQRVNMVTLISDAGSCSTSPPCGGQQPGQARDPGQGGVTGGGLGTELPASAPMWGWWQGECPALPGGVPLGPHWTPGPLPGFLNVRHGCSPPAPPPCVQKAEIPRWSPFLLPLATWGWQLCSRGCFPASRPIALPVSLCRHHYPGASVGNGADSALQGPPWPPPAPHPLSVPTSLFAPSLPPCLEQNWIETLPAP